MNESFEILAAEYRPMLLTFLRSLGADAHLAEDLAQETYMAAFQSLSTLEKRENFGAWLRGIARNKALMHWRSTSRRPLTVDSRIVEGIEEVFEELDRDAEEGDWWEKRRRAMRECIAGLSGQLRAAVMRVYTNGDTPEEAAAVLQSTRVAINQRLSRARKLVRVCAHRKLKSNS